MRHLRDTLGYRARRAQPHVRLADPPGQHGPAVAHAPVIRVSRAALAPACAPLSGQRGAPGLDRGPDRRIDLFIASEVAADTCCRHSPSAAVAACHAAASCWFGLPASSAISAIFSPGASLSKSGQRVTAARGRGRHQPGGSQPGRPGRGLPG